MRLRFAVPLWFAVMTCWVPATVLAQSESGDDLYYLPLGTMAWWKLTLIAVGFLIWLRLADWVNRDSNQVHERTGIQPIHVNPITVGAFAIGLASVLLIPFFLAGFPIFIVGIVAPFLGYLFIRNSRMPEHMTAFTKSHLSRTVAPETPLVQDANLDVEWPPIKLEARGDETTAQANLIRARQACDWVILRSLVYNALSSRADSLVGRRTAQGGQWRKRIDGVWHTLAPMEAPAAEGSYRALKLLAGINPADRSARQTGHFAARMTEATRCDLTFVRDAKSETVQFKFIQPKQIALKLPELGLFPNDLELLTAAINSSGFMIISAPPGEGLSTTWHALLVHSDRVTKDWVALIDYNESETTIENIEPFLYDSREKQRPVDILRSILLKQPEVFVVPALNDRDSMNAMVEQVIVEQRAAFTRVVAPSAAAALSLVGKHAADRGKFLQALTLVTSQRLVRRLCSKCRHPMQVTPELIRKLGGDPQNPPTIYKQYSPPDPLPVDKKGNPIEIEPCSKCAGVGYFGRLALIELMLVDDDLRSALRGQPDETTLTRIGLSQRGRSAMQQGFRHVLAGHTSLAEIQRVFKPAK